MMNAPLRILAIAAICVTALISLVMREGMARDQGTEVILAMEAVDPRSLLSGHYVILNLQEATETPDQCRDFNPAPSGQSWVVLRDRSADLVTEKDRATRASHVAIGQYESRADALLLGDIVVKANAICTDATTEGDDVRPGVLSLGIAGINRYYASQSEAEHIEHLMRDQEKEGAVFAVLSIGDDGRARLKGLVVNGERLDLNWL